MNRKKEKEALFPWMESVICSFAESFMSDYNIETLIFLHRSIDDEIKYISINEGVVYTVARAQALYNELMNLYDHMRLKIGHRHSNFPNATISCVKLLSQVIKAGLVLTQGLEKSKWIERMLTAIKFFTGKSDLIYDVLLLVNGLKKIYHKPYALILKCVLVNDHHEYIITDPLVYMKIILLFRRLSALMANRDQCTILISKVKPPPNLITWLLSLDIGDNSHLKHLKHKRLAQQLIRRSLPESLLQKIRDVALSPYSFGQKEATYDYHVAKKPMNDSLDLFMIDASESSKKKLKSLAKNKNRKSPIKMAEEQSTSNAGCVSYINDYSNLVVEDEDSDSESDSKTSNTYNKYDSENDSAEFAANSDHAVVRPRKKQKSKNRHKILHAELEAKTVNEAQDLNSDPFFQNEIPSKKPKRDRENLSYSSNTLKRGMIKNADISETVKSEDEAPKDRGELMRTMCDLKCISRSANSKASGKFTNDGIEIIEISSDEADLNIETLPKRRKKSIESICRTASPSKIEISNANQKKSPSNIAGNSKDRYFTILLPEVTKFVSQISSPVKSRKKREKSSEDSDSTNKILSTPKKKISKRTESENDSSNVTNNSKSEFFRNLSLKKKEYVTSLKTTDNDENESSIEPSVAIETENSTKLLPENEIGAVMKSGDLEPLDKTSFSEQMPEVIHHNSFCISAQNITETGINCENTLENTEPVSNAENVIHLVSDYQEISMPIEKDSIPSETVQNKKEKVTEKEKLLLFSENLNSELDMCQHEKNLQKTDDFIRANSVNDVSNSFATTEIVSPQLHSLLTYTEAPSPSKQAIGLNIPDSNSLEPLISVPETEILKTGEIYVNKELQTADNKSVESSINKIASSEYLEDKNEKSCLIAVADVNVSCDNGATTDFVGKAENAGNCDKHDLNASENLMQTSVSSQRIDTIFVDQNVSSNTLDIHSKECDLTNNENQKVIEDLIVHSEKNSGIELEKDNSKESEISVINANSSDSASQNENLNVIVDSNEIDLCRNDVSVVQDTCSIIHSRPIESESKNVLTVPSESDVALKHGNDINENTPSSCAFESNVEKLKIVCNTESDNQKADEVIINNDSNVEVANTICGDDSESKLNLPKNSLQSISNTTVANFNETKSCVHDSVIKIEEICNSSLSDAKLPSSPELSKSPQISQDLCISSPTASSGENNMKDPTCVKAYETKYENKYLVFKNESMTDTISSRVVQMFLSNIISTNQREEDLLKNEKHDHAVLISNDVSENETVNLHQANLCNNSECVDEKGNKEITKIKADFINKNDDLSEHENEKMDAIQMNFSQTADLDKNECVSENIDINETDLINENDCKNEKTEIVQTNLNNQSEDLNENLEMTKRDLANKNEGLNANEKMAVNQKGLISQNQDLLEGKKLDLNETDLMDISNDPNTNVNKCRDEEMEIIRKSRDNQNEDLNENVEIAERDVIKKSEELNASMTINKSVLKNQNEDLCENEKSNLNKTDFINQTTLINKNETVIENKDTNLNQACFKNVEKLNAKKNEEILVKKAEFVNKNDNLSENEKLTFNQSDLMNCSEDFNATENEKMTIKEQICITEEEKLGTENFADRINDLSKDKVEKIMSESNLNENKKIDLKQADLNTESEKVVIKEVNFDNNSEILCKNRTGKIDMNMLNKSGDLSENKIDFVDNSDDLNLNTNENEKMSMKEKYFTDKCEILSEKLETDQTNLADRCTYLNKVDSVNEKINVNQVDIINKSEDLSKPSSVIITSSDVDLCNAFTGPIFEENECDIVHPLESLHDVKKDTEVLGKESNKAALTHTKAKDSSSHVAEESKQCTSDIDTDLLDNSNDNKTVIPCVNESEELNCTSAKSVINEISESVTTNEVASNCTKEIESQNTKTYEESIEKKPLKISSEILTSEYIPSFCTNQSYVTFSDISLRDKDKSIDVDSGLKSPITHFSSAASAEIFSMYRSDLFQNDDKASLVSRDNEHEMSDEAKSQGLSSDHSEDDYDDDGVNMFEIKQAGCPTPSVGDNLPDSLQNDDKDKKEETELNRKSNMLSPEKNENALNSTAPCLSETHQVNDVTDEQEPKEILPRQSLRLRSKTDANNKTGVEENSKCDIPNSTSMFQNDMTGVETTDKCNPDAEDSVNKDLIASSSSSKDIPDILQTNISSQKCTPKKSSTLKVKAKEGPSISKRYSLRHPKSSRVKDGPSDLEIDLTKLYLDSPSSTKNTKSKRKVSKFVKLLTSNVGSEDQKDADSTTKRETRSSSFAKSEKEAGPSTPSYNLRNRQSIIAPARLKI